MNKLNTALLVLLATLLPALAGTPTAVAQDDDADGKIVEEFRNLQQSLQNLRGIRKDNLAVVEAFAARVDEVLAGDPENPQLLAIRIQLSIWTDDREAVHEGFRRLVQATGDAETYGTAWIDWFERQKDEDDERIDSIYATLQTMMPDNVPVSLRWVRRLQDYGRYEEACSILDELEIDLNEHPDSAITRYQCCMATYRFEDARAALEAIPAEQVDTDATLKSRQLLNLTKAENYIEFWANEQALRSSEAELDDLPRVEIVTDRGRMVVELFENEAPNTVANFISLVESGFYDGVKVHHRQSGSWIESGNPMTREEGEPATASNPGYTIADEHGTDADRVHFTGTLAMGHGVDKNSGGSMFYLTLRPVPERNKLYTTFGRVIEGLDVLQALRKDDVMQTFRVLRKRDHDYVPVTTPVGGATAATPETTGDADDIAGDAGDDGAEPVTVGNAPGEGDDS